MSLWLRKFATLTAGRAFEESLWQTGGPTLQAWSCGAGLSVPASFRAAPRFAQACAAMEQRRWPVVVRQTGGGCVPQGAGVVNLAWMPADGGKGSGIDELYDRFSGAILEALRAVGVDAERRSPDGAWCVGRYDLCTRGRKLAGISQRRAIGARSRSFVHGAIFVDCDLAAGFAEMTRFLSLAGHESRPSRNAATSIEAEQNLATGARQAVVVAMLRAAEQALLPEMMSRGASSNDMADKELSP